MIFRVRWIEGRGIRTAECLLPVKVSCNIRFLARKERIDDSKGCNFEHILFTSIDEQKDFVFYPFLIRPLWRGISGTNGREYWEGNYTSLKLAYFKRMLNCMTEYNMCHPHNKPSMGVRLVLGMAGMAVGTVLRFFDWIKNE